jgi:predicted NodU family carbamoyl transferase
VPVEHHLAHASAAYYTSPWNRETALVVTCDGSGDRLSATVSTAERAGEYYVKPKPCDSPYMMMAFRSRPEKRAALAAAIHPQDFTTRPQEVSAADNPGYYRLLEEYRARTGEAAVLNSSFNLHGEPMVYRARDAVDVFLRSGLEYMALGHWWVEKRSVSA